MGLMDNELILIVKKATGTFTKGHYTDGAITYVNAYASVQPINDDELQMLNIGDRVKGTKKFYSESNIAFDDFIRRIDPIKAPGENIAKIVTCTVDNVLDSIDYTCEINTTEFLFNSGVGATALSIVAGIVNEINNGAEPVSVIDNLDGTYTITSTIQGTNFTILTDADQSINIDVENVKKEYKIMQSKDYSMHGIPHYKAYGYLVESSNGL